MSRLDLEGEGKLKQCNVTAYTLEGCVHCMHLHELLERSNVPNERVTYVDVGKDISKEDFIKKFPEANGYPHVIIDGKPIGGLVETAKYLVKKKMVSTTPNG